MIGFHCGAFRSICNLARAAIGQERLKVGFVPQNRHLGSIKACRGKLQALDGRFEPKATPTRGLHS